jgi:carboxymethylenebutenolidase
LGKVKGELCIACAEHNNLAPLPMVEELRTLFGRAGTAGDMELYPGVHHFAFPQRRCYDKPAAERHWEQLIVLYRRRLVHTQPLRPTGIGGALLRLNGPMTSFRH